MRPLPMPRHRTTARLVTRALPLTLAALLLAGCASTGVVQVGASRFAAKPEGCKLDVYASREDVKRPFEAICLISSESGRTLFNDRSDEGRVEAVREKACACGADAVIMRDLVRSATQFGVGYSGVRVSAEAIVYR